MCDTAEEIEVYLDNFNLAGLVKEIGEYRRTPIKEWVLYGKFFLNAEGLHTLVDSRLPKIQRVVSYKALKEIFGDSLFLSYSYGAYFPNTESKCSECNRGWNPDNLPDFVVVSMQNEQPVFMHNCCANIYYRRKERQYFLELLQEAGYDPVMTEIKNQYWKTDPVPWFEVAIPEGKLVIGWRKRVISISFEGDSKIDFKELFPNENVTLERNLIHAWGKEKAIAYLKTIRTWLTNFGTTYEQIRSTEINC